MPAAGVSLYAQWEANDYNVTYYGNGNTGGSAPIDSDNPYIYEEEVTVLAKGTLTKTGYTFDGWNTKADGTGTAYAPTDTFDMPAAGVSLYAQWEANDYNVTYYGNGNTGGSAPIDSDNPYIYEEEVTVLAKGTLTKTGYTFDGWNTKADGTGTAYAPTDTFDMPAAGVSLYAQWEANDYNVTYYGNGNTGGSAPIDSDNPYIYEEEVTVLAKGTLKKIGYTFDGWNTKADGTGTAYAPTDTFDMPAAGVSLYAQWEANSYTVTYDKNNASATGTTADSTHVFDVAKKLNNERILLNGLYV